jgi:hypothetical protein
METGMLSSDYKSHLGTNLGYPRFWRYESMLCFEDVSLEHQERPQNVALSKKIVSVVLGGECQVRKIFGEKA